MKITLLVLMLWLAASAVHAEMYRWVDKQGKVHYTDEPPPQDAKKVEEKKFGNNVVSGDRLPYATQQAAKTFPVTLYTGDCGEACKIGKAYLVKRGIPFAERHPSQNATDFADLKKLVGDNMIPVLVVGKTTLKGFSEASWSSTLDAAGYPKSSAATVPTSTPSAPAGTAAPNPAPTTPKPEDGSRKSY